MTYQSCVAAAISLITTNLPGNFTTVADLDDRETEAVRPDDLPACLFTMAAPATTTRIGVGGTGLRREEWLLEAHIWRFDTPVPGTLPSFRALVERVRTLFLSKHQLGGLADALPGTQLLTSAEGPSAVTTTFSKPIRRGATAERHALVTVRIRDLVYA